METDSYKVQSTPQQISQSSVLLIWDDVLHLILWYHLHFLWEQQLLMKFSPSIFSLKFSVVLGQMVQPLQSAGYRVHLLKMTQLWFAYLLSPNLVSSKLLERIYIASRVRFVIRESVHCETPDWTTTRFSFNVIEKKQGCVCDQEDHLTCTCFCLKLQWGNHSKGFQHGIRNFHPTMALWWLL